jgi:hypothetical protein
MRGNVNVVMSTPRLIRFSNQFEATQHLLDLIVHVRTLLCLASTSQKKLSLRPPRSHTVLYNNALSLSRHPTFKPKGANKLQHALAFF